MALGARKSESKVDNPVPGTYMARLVGIVDLGHQPGYQGKGYDIEPSYQLRLSYELPGSRTKEDRPHWVHENVKNSDFFDKKKGLSSKLMKRVYALDPSGTKSDNGKNLVSLIGVPCMVEVALNEGGYPKIMNVTGAPAGIPVPELENDPILFDMADPDMEVFRRLPEFIRNMMKENLDYAGSALEIKVLEMGDDEEENDSPF